MFGGYYTGLPYPGQSDGLVFGVDLVVADMLHSHALDNIVLTQVHNLTIADMVHGHSLDGGLILVENKTLAVQEMLHTHTLDSIVLTQAHILALTDMLHSHNLDSITLSQIHNLLVADMLHAHNLDAAFVSILQTLVMNNMLHEHTLDNIAIGVYAKIKPDIAMVKKAILVTEVSKDNPQVLVKRPNTIGVGLTSTKPQGEATKYEKPHVLI